MEYRPAQRCLVEFAILKSLLMGSPQDRRSIRPSKHDQKNIPPFIQFTLHKTNRETQDCISHLAIKLGVNVKDLATAGTKDKRGVTTQLVTLRRFKRTIEEVWDQANGLHHGRSKDAFRGGKGKGRGNGFLDRDGMLPRERGERGMRIGDLKYVEEPLDLGMLDGNRFCIVLRYALPNSTFGRSRRLLGGGLTPKTKLVFRDVRVDDNQVIPSSLATLQSTGFLNFFGMQRFGNSSVPTHAIGLALLQCDWSEAARLILSERDGDAEELRQARQAWNVDKDAKKALQQIPKWAVAERCLLESYSKNGGDSNQHGALSTIPKNLKMMYVHAYQSYLWNSAVSERMRLFGCEKPVVGDLVYAAVSKDTSSAAVPTGKVTKDSLKAASKVAKVKVLTEEDLDKYTIHDIVLPLPGYSVTYPTGEIGALYRQMMEADKLDPDDLFRKQKEFSLGGAYRKILTKPINLTWEILHYTDMDEQLLQPDEDKLLEIAFEAPQGEKTALKVEFSLDTASYATMALREILKMETGNVQQKEMSEQAKA